MYFLGVPRADWPPAVDARPIVQPEESSLGISSESKDTDVDRTVSPPGVGEILGETGSDRRASPKEEEDGDYRSPQIG